MTNYLYVLALALMPAFGNFAGGVAAELIPTSRRMLNCALHAAAGIVTAVVAVELMPRRWRFSTALGLCLGGAFYVLVEWFVDLMQGGNEDAAGAWMIYVAVAIDLFSDGLMIGVGSVVSFGLAFILALGQIMADVPEGFATIANFKEKGASRRRRIVLSASFVVPCLLGASIGFWLLRGQGER